MKTLIGLILSKCLSLAFKTGKYKLNNKQQIFKHECKNEFELKRSKYGLEIKVDAIVIKRIINDMEIYYTVTSSTLCKLFYSLNT